MSVTLFAQNLLETATVTASRPALTPLARLYDRDRAAPYEPAFAQAWTLTQVYPLHLALGQPAPVQLDLDFDLGSAKAVSAWAFVNHNLGGVTVTLYGDSSSPPTTSRDSFTPTAGVDVLRTFASQTLRYWRVRIPAMASAPTIGEFLLGVPRVISENPSFSSAGRVSVGNVRRDISPGGTVRRLKVGEPRTRLAYAWNGLSHADETERAAAYAEADEGAKALLVLDDLGVLRWMEIEDAESAPEPVRSASTAGNRLYAARLTLLESLA